VTNLVAEVNIAKVLVEEVITIATTRAGAITGTTGNLAKSDTKLFFSKNQPVLLKISIEITGKLKEKIFE
jgi:hypothetical protein